jgi:hypothetical protein
VLAAAALCAAAVAGGRYLAGESPGTVQSALDQATSRVPFWLAVGAILVVNVRALLFRLEDRDA